MSKSGILLSVSAQDLELVQREAERLSVGREDFIKACALEYARRCGFHFSSEQTATRCPSLWGQPPDEVGRTQRLRVYLEPAEEEVIRAAAGYLKFIGTARVLEVLPEIFVREATLRILDKLPSNPEERQAELRKLLDKARPRGGEAPRQPVCTPAVVLTFAPAPRGSRNSGALRPLARASPPARSPAAVCPARGLSPEPEQPRPALLRALPSLAVEREESLTAVGYSPAPGKALLYHPHFLVVMGGGGLATTLLAALLLLRAAEPVPARADPAPSQGTTPALAPASGSSVAPSSPLPGPKPEAGATSTEAGPLRDGGPYLLRDADGAGTLPRDTSGGLIPRPATPEPPHLLTGPGVPTGEVSPGG